MSHHIEIVPCDFPVWSERSSRRGGVESGSTSIEARPWCIFRISASGSTLQAIDEGWSWKLHPGLSMIAVALPDVMDGEDEKSLMPGLWRRGGPRSGCWECLMFESDSTEGHFLLENHLAFAGGEVLVTFLFSFAHVFRH